MLFRSISHLTYCTSIHALVKCYNTNTYSNTCTNFGSLKRECILINTSRGEIIDEEFLAELLFKKRIGGAGLDVFEHEPQITQKLFDSENVILLPHISSATKESRIAMGERVLKNIFSSLNGKNCPDLVLINKD